MEDPNSCSTDYARDEGEKKQQEEHTKEETDPTRTTAAGLNGRFLQITTKKDEGNFLFREKKYTAALERYIEAMLELKVYRRLWRQNRRQKMVSVVAVTVATGSTTNCASAQTEQVSTILGKRSSKEKGKERMDIEDDKVVAAAAEEGCRGGNAMTIVEEAAQKQQPCSSSADRKDTATTTTATSSSSVYADTIVDWDGVRRKRRRLGDAPCANGSGAVLDDMNVEIIDKADYAMPQDMGCRISSSSSSSSSSCSAASSKQASISGDTASVQPAEWSKHRPFRELSECEKNLKRLEIIIRLNVAACGIRLGFGAQALEQCRKVVRINDIECCEPLLYAKALFRKAQSQKILGLNKEACASLRLAASFSPTDRAIRNELTALEQAMKKGSVVCQLFQQLLCRRQDDAEDSQPPPSPPQEAPKNKCKFLSFFSSSTCPAKTALSTLFRREISTRGLTPRQKAVVASSQLPRDPPALVDKYARRAYAAEWSNDGDLLYTTCQDWKIRIYAHDSKTLSQKCVINAKKGQWTITDAQMSSDKSFLLYSSITPLVHMVPLPGDLNDLKPKGISGRDHHPHQQQPHYQLAMTVTGSDYSGIWCMTLSPDDREVVAGTSDGTVCVYDLESNQLVERATAHSEDVNSICYVETDNGFGSSAHLLASAADDGLIRVWDRRCMTDPVGTLHGHTEGLTYLASKGDGRYLLSNGKDQTMKLWDLRNMVDRRHAEPPVKKYVWDYRGMSYPGHPETDRHPHDLSVATFRGHTVLRTLIRCKFSPPAWSGYRYACTASTDGKVYIHDASSTQLVRVYDTGCKETTGSGAVVRTLAWHPYLPYLVTAAWNGAVSLFSHDAKPATVGDE